MKLSARDENLGPSIVTTVPEIIGKVRITVVLAQYIIVNGDKLNRKMFFNAKNFKFQIFFVKIFLDTKPFDCLNTIFFRNCFLGLQSTKCQMV